MNYQMNIDASIEGLKVQIGQIAMQLADSHTTTFSAYTINNPKEHYSAFAIEEAEEESTDQMVGC
jgi:hypothetical protein